MNIRYKIKIQIINKVLNKIGLVLCIKFEDHVKVIAEINIFRLKKYNKLNEY